MNSSGIKRGLAVSAISALALTGVPALATPASAATGDTFTTVFEGPARNGGDEGALVILRTDDGATINTALIKAVGTNGTNAGTAGTPGTPGTPGNDGPDGLPGTGDDVAPIPAIPPTAPTNGSEDSDTQNVQVISATNVGDDPADNSTDFDLIEVRVAVTTTPVGATANYRLFEDVNGNNVLDAGEARDTVATTTAGPVASIEVTPASQSAPEDIPSGDYTVTLKDAAGRTTQLLAGDSLNISSEGPVVGAVPGNAGPDGIPGTGDDVAPIPGTPDTATIVETGPDTDTPNNRNISSDEIVRGIATFTAEGSETGRYDILVENAAGTIEDTAVLNVTEAAELDADDIDIVTGADSWDGPGDGTDGGTTFVRVDQNTIRFDFEDDTQPGANVQLTASSSQVTFGGQDEVTLSTTLDENGVGSITLNVDTASIQDGDELSVDINGFDQIIEFQRSAVAADDLKAPELVFTQVDTPASVTVTVVDQFGQPVAGAQVSAEINGNGVGGDAASDRPRQTTNASGQTTFTFPAGDTQVGDSDTITYTVFQDAADPMGDPSNQTTQVRYTADGLGPEFQILLDGENTEGATYSPDDVTVRPLADAVANQNNADKGDEVVNLTLTGGNTGSPVTVSVDNGALILDGGNDLQDGVSSLEGEVGDTFRIVGTTAGIVTVTTTTNGRTETAQFTVEAQDDDFTARNVTVSGPATVPAGTTQIQYTAVITDAFGNPVEGVAVSQLNVQVTGPAEFQDSDAVSNAAGQINLNVRVDAGAQGVVTIRVQGLGSQFGADEDRLTAGSQTDNAAGFDESSDVATASTTVAAPVNPDPEPEPDPDPEPPVRTKINVNTFVGNANGGKTDKIRINVTGNRAPIGATATLFKRINGRNVKLRAKQLSSRAAQFAVRDLNAKQLTLYFVKVSKSPTTFGKTGPVKKVR